MTPSLSADTSNTVVILDGHNLLFRFFFGMPTTIRAKTGAPIQGAYGFIASVLQHMRRFAPAQLIVCFDSQGPPERSNSNPEYKANRQWAYTPGATDNPFTQLEYIEPALALLKVPTLSREGTEADDLIASLRKQLRSVYKRIILGSADHDLFQLVDDNTCIYVKRGQREDIITPDWVKNKFGVTPAQFNEWRALVGDPSDNISGVRGIGKVTATGLLTQYNALSDIFANLRDLPPRHASALASHREAIWENVALLSIHDDVPIDSKVLEDISHSVTDSSISVRGVFSTLGFL